MREKQSAHLWLPCAGEASRSEGWIADPRRAPGLHVQHAWRIAGASHRREPHSTRQPWTGTRDVLRPYAGWMLDLDAIDVEKIANALADQTDYDHRWLIDRTAGEIAFWTSDLGIDGENPVDLLTSST